MILQAYRHAKARGLRGVARDDAGVAGWRRLLLFALSGAVLVTSFLVGRPTVSYADGVPQAVVAWGRNSWGEATVPQGLTDVKAISATAHSMVLRSDGTVYSWGHDKYGETDVPAGLSDVAAISAGGFHSMALKSDGTLVEWGQNDYGQATVPTGLGHVAAISGGRFHSLALRDDGTVAAWGDNEDGQSTVPAGLHDVVAIDGGGFHSLALLRDGTVVAWGANEYGQSTVPSGLHDVVAIAAGWYHSMALKSDGTVVAWGQNTYGQATVPAGLPPVAYISAGATHSLVAFRDGTVATWGDNAWGQMEVPGGLTGVTRITGKAMHSMVMADDPPPSPVTNLTASIVTSSKVTLTWGYPAEPSDHDIDRIVVRGAAGVVAPASVTDGVVVPTGRPLTTLVNDLSGLQPGQRYSYSVFAIDRAGNVGMPASVTVPVSFREPVTDAAATVESSTSVSLSWKNPANDQLKKIIVRRAVGSVAPASETSGANVSLSSALAESVTNTGLLSGTQYSYSIFAQDRVGNVSVLGAGSTVTVTTTAQPSPSPTASPTPTPSEFHVSVTDLAASVAASKVTLTWAYPSGGGVDRIVVRGAAGVVAPASVTDGVEVPTGKARATLVNDPISLALGQRYSYSVFAVDAAGNAGPRASVTVPVSFREPVTDAAATVESSTSVSLSWKNPANDQLKKIIVRRAVGSEAPASETSGANVSLSSALAESVTNTGLLSGTQYSYSIFAQDRVGNVSVLGAGSTVTVTTTAQPSPSPTPTPTPSPTPGG